MESKKMTDEQIERAALFDRIVAWGAKPENQEKFDELKEYYIYPQKLPVDAKEAADFGGVPTYLMYCEGQANFVRALKSLKAIYDAKQMKLNRSPTNG